MKKSLIIFIIVCFSFMVSFSSVQAETEFDEPIHLGAIFSTTGALAELGQEAMHVIDITEDFINDRGGIGGYPLEITVYEGETDPSVFASRAHRLIESDEVLAGFGGTDLALSTAAGEVFLENQLTYINTAGSTPTIAEIGDYVFSSVQPDNDQGRAAAYYFTEVKGFEKFAIFNDEAQEFTTNMTDYFKFYLDEFSPAEDPVPITLSYETGDTDFSSQITNLMMELRDTDIDAVWISSFPAEAPQIVRQMKDFDIDLPALTVCGADSHTLTDVGGDAVEGMMYTTHYAYGMPMSEIAEEFEEVYLDHYQDDDILSVPGGHGFQALESVLQYKEAIEYILDDRGHDWWDGADRFEKAEVIRDTLAKIEFKNTTPHVNYKFDEVGRPQFGMPVAIVEDGERVFHEYLRYDDFTPEGIELDPIY